MLGDRSTDDRAHGAIFGASLRLERADMLIGNDCGNLRHGSAYRRSLRLALGQARREFREVSKSWRAFGQVPLEPAHRCPLVLRRAALGVEMDERTGRLQGKGFGSSRAASSAIQSAPRSIARGKRNVGVGLGGQEGM
jgi:hypothetical protein